eukprot:CAMPEP_0119565144 /NCGR_PEP_ID=MMETSP1352-20130426/29147_1 /TAXON_ID=265584 /ORGANISM="Stauroneis constricta, Strain CCMP1120" /LENGTH=63 /DNA_ID=CAMNT_0007614007 /DNA_START=211 /DNA_END=402 /DNA_ORIENTATION=+
MSFSVTTSADSTSSSDGSSSTDSAYAVTIKERKETFRDISAARASYIHRSSPHNVFFLSAPMQ